MAQITSKAAVAAAISGIQAVAQGLLASVEGDARAAATTLTTALADAAPDLERITDLAITSGDPSTWYNTLNAELDAELLLGVAQAETMNSEIQAQIRAAAVAAIHTAIGLAVSSIVGA